MSLSAQFSEIHDKATALQTVFDTTAALKTAELTECLRLQPNRCVFLGQLDGQPVVFKQFSLPQGAEIIKAQRQELSYMADFMASGPYQLNRHILSVPDAGLAVLSRVPGQPLAEALKTASNRERSELLKKSGEWLQCYCDPRRLQKPFAAGYWVKQLSQEISQCTDYGTQTVALEMLAHLRQQADSLAQAQVTHAATHGDFTIWNIHVHNDTLYGVDVDRITRMPIGRDIATFLCRLQRNDPRAENQRRHGIATSDFKAFLDCDLISEVEVETVLAFLIGLEFTRLWLTEAAGTDRRRNLKQAIDHYLGDQ